MAVITLASGTVPLSSALAFKAIPASVFGLLQTLMDAEINDVNLRRDGIENLMAYHAATSTNDKYSAVVVIEHMRRQALLLLDHMYNVYGSGGLPVHRPAPNALSEVVTAVTTRRSGKNQTPLPGPKS